MEAASTRKKIGGGFSGDALANRRTTLTIAVLAAILAGVLLYAFVQHYKNNVNKSVSSSSVLIASGFIPKGASADTIASGNLFQRSTVKTNQLNQGAIANAGLLHGEVATTNIYPGQQLTAAEFAPSSGSISSQLTGTYRAVAVPVDSSHGLSGVVQAGNHVDILVSFSGGQSSARGAVSTLAQNVLVLSAPSSGGGGIGGGSGNSEIVLRVTDKQALALAFAADNGKVWVTLRPPVGAQQSVSSNAQ